MRWQYMRHEAEPVAVPAAGGGAPAWCQRRVFRGGVVATLPSAATSTMTASAGGSGPCEPSSSSSSSATSSVPTCLKHAASTAAEARTHLHADASMGDGDIHTECGRRVVADGHRRYIHGVTTAEYDEG